MRIILAAALLLGIPLLLPSSGLAQGISHEALENQVVELINGHRESIGLTPLMPDSHIADTSRTHSADMANGRSPFSHEGFDKRVERIRKALGGMGFAENVAFGYRTAQVVVGWLNSPGHKANIEGDFTHTGVGIALARDGSLFFTQMFVKR
ncbi:MAG: CAP domain-containing protein [Methylomonas sp.]|nr:CAP domain-containing protein [Methylomonas sp.]